MFVPKHAEEERLLASFPTGDTPQVLTNSSRWIAWGSCMTSASPHAPSARAARAPTPMLLMLPPVCSSSIHSCVGVHCPEYW